jgi:hypothetical protein
MTPRYGRCFRIAVAQEACVCVSDPCARRGAENHSDSKQNQKASLSVWMRAVAGRHEARGTTAQRCPRYEQRELMIRIRDTGTSLLVTAQKDMIIKIGV